MAKDVKKTQSKKVVKEDSKKTNKKENVKKEKVVKENIKKSNKKEKEVKEEVIVTKENNSKNTDKLLSTVKVIDDNRKAILFGIVGFLLSTLLFRCILWPDRIATLKDGTQPIASVNGETITANDLYDSMKEHYSVNILLNDIDNMILVEMYPDDDDLNSEVQETAEYYYSSYESYYGYTKEDFLTNYGFSSESDFIESLKLDYRRNKYYEEYARNLVTDKEIDKYYENKVFGDVDSKHILVKIDKDGKDGLSDTEANKLAKEIIKKLDSGKSWDEVIDEYGDQIVHEELGYNAFNASLESTYLEECKNLKVGKYSKTPVLTSYGYHIVYKVDQKEKPSLDDVKDDIIEILAEEKTEADNNLYYKAMIDMREKAGLEFTDTKLGDEYKEYRNTYK